MNVVDVSLGPLGARYVIDSGVLIDYSPDPACNKRLSFIGLAGSHYVVTFQADYIVTARAGIIAQPCETVDVPGSLLRFRVFSPTGVLVGEWKADENPMRWLCD